MATDVGVATDVDAWLADTSRAAALASVAGPSTATPAPLISPRGASKNSGQDALESMGRRLVMSTMPEPVDINETGIRMLPLKKAFKAQQPYTTAPTNILAPLENVDDGLYRSPVNLSRREPWNLERIVLQLSREADGRGTESLLRSGEDIVGVGFVVPRNACGFIPAVEDIFVETSSFRCERAQLKSSKMHILEVAVDDIRFSAVPNADFLLSDEDKLAATLVNYYEEYKEKSKVDVDAMDQQHVQLVAFGKSLQQACVRERAEGTGAIIHEEQWNMHVKERRKLRSDRFRAETELSDAQTKCYMAWQDLRRHRQAVGYTSTRWKLEAAEQKKDTQFEQCMRDKEMDAQLEEVMMDAWPKEIDWTAERARLGCNRRPPGASVYRFQLLATEQVSHSLDESIPEHAIEMRRRKILDSGNVFLTVALLVNGEHLHTLPSSPVRSCSGWAFDASIGAFRIALHTFPSQLQLDISLCHARVPKVLKPHWRLRRQVDVPIPSSRVAHATHRAPQRHACRLQSAGMEGCVGVTVGWAPGSGLESHASAVADPAARPLRMHEGLDPLDPLAIGAQAVAPHRSAGDARTFDTQVLSSYPRLVHNSKVLEGTKRMKRLMARLAVGPTKPIPIFDRELRTELKDKTIDVVCNVPAHAKDDAVENFIRKIQERTKTVSAVHTGLTLRSIVSEYEGDFLWFLHGESVPGTSMLSLLKPARGLKPSGKPREMDPKALVANLHIIVAKITNAPLRLDHSPDAQKSRGTPPEVVVSITFENLDGDALVQDTAPPVWGQNPDINRHRVLPLASGKRPDVTLSTGTLEMFDNSVYFNVFDEVLTSGGRRERRFLGTFELPWSTLYESNCKVSGTFFVKSPEHLIGYVTQERHMQISLNCTVDKHLVLAARKQTRIVPGREPRLLLAGISRWMDSFGVNPLGIDIDGRSRLICRFLTPQAPPEQVCTSSDPQAIEKCARYVSLIPFLTDKQMFSGKVVDLWCTTDQFFDIRCGDWEEHAILLCNYFNYIDGERRRTDSSHNITSYCADAKSIPDGDSMYVLRRDLTSGHCELWDATTARCYFIPFTPCPLSTMQRLAAAYAHCRGRPSNHPPQPDNVLVSDAPHCPIEEITMVFSGENVWANKRCQQLTAPALNLENKAMWQPLFEVPTRRLFGLLASSTKGIERAKVLPNEPDTLTTVQVSPLVYTASDFATATSTAQRLEDYLWQKIYHSRSAMQRTTHTNTGVGRQLAEMCDTLEDHVRSHRRGGADTPPPLKMHRGDENTSGVIEARMERVMNDFQGLYRGKHVYGLPLNFSFSGFDVLWRKVSNTSLVSMGDDDAEYSLGVRVFAYPNMTYSIWIFIVCASRE